MALRVITKDILTVEEGIICHQVNCCGVMGRGIAKSIADKWPIVLKEYKKFCSMEANHANLLGSLYVVPVKLPNAELQVANVFGQLNYGSKGLFTDYKAVDKAFTSVARMGYKLPIYIPYNMGCGLAGGDWATYSGIVEKHVPGAIICCMPSKSV